MLRCSERFFKVLLVAARCSEWLLGVGLLSSNQKCPLPRLHDILIPRYSWRASVSLSLWGFFSCQPQKVQNSENISAKNIIIMQSHCKYSCLSGFYCIAKILQVVARMLLGSFWDVLTGYQSSEQEIMGYSMQVFWINC